MSARVCSARITIKISRGRLCWVLPDLYNRPTWYNCPPHSSRPPCRSRARKKAVANGLLPGSGTTGGTGGMGGTIVPGGTVIKVGQDPAQASSTYFYCNPSTQNAGTQLNLSLIHIFEPTRLGMISYAVF